MDNIIANMLHVNLTCSFSDIMKDIVEKLSTGTLRYRTAIMSVYVQCKCE